jgi:hypothetical protein
MLPEKSSQLETSSQEIAHQERPISSPLEPSLHEEVAYQERLRQASLAFNLAFIATALSVAISFANFIFLATGRIPASNVITSCELVSKIAVVRCLQFSREANDRFDKAARRQVKNRKSSQ